MGTTIIAVERNPYNGTWEVGWKDQNDGEFTPYLCGLETREEAEAEIPGFDERVRREFDAYVREQEAIEAEQNARWPNLGHVRARIKKLRDSGDAKKWAASLDASSKLDALLDMGLHEFIEWPLPSWKAIKSRRVYGW
jgi:hypothetical protein